MTLPPADTKIPRNDDVAAQKLIATALSEQKEWSIIRLNNYPKLPVYRLGGAVDVLLREKKPEKPRTLSIRVWYNAEDSTYDGGRSVNRTAEPNLYTTYGELLEALRVVLS